MGTYIMLAGNVVNTAIARPIAQIRATEDLIVLEKEQVSITRAQRSQARCRFSNVLSLQSELASTQATLPPLRQKIDQANHLLATLLGRCTADFSSASGAQGWRSRTSSSRRTAVSLPSEWCTSVLTFFRQKPAHQCQRADRCRHGSHVSSLTLNATVE